VTICLRKRRNVFKNGCQFKIAKKTDGKTDGRKMIDEREETISVDDEASGRGVLADVGPRALALRVYRQ
jgi:hypothetical protein